MKENTKGHRFKNKKNAYKWETPREADCTLLTIMCFGYTCFQKGKDQNIYCKLDYGVQVESQLFKKKNTIVYLENL